MVWKFCEIWESYGKWGPEGPKFCEILSHSVRYGMYEPVSSNPIGWKLEVGMASKFIQQGKG